MALLRNRGRTEPSGEEWAKTGNDSQGKEHSIINYSATLNKQSHITSQRERVFRVRHVTDDHLRRYGPPQINLFKGDVDDHSHFPQSTAYGSPKKAEEFSPKERLRAAHMKNNPFSRDDDHSSTDASDDDPYPTKDDNYDRHGGYGGSYPPKLVRTRPELDTDYSNESQKGAARKPSLVPPAGTRHETARNRPIVHSPPRSKPETYTLPPEAGRKPLFEPTMGRHPQYGRPSVHSPLRSKPESQTGYASDSPKAGRHPSFDSPAGREPHHTFPVKDSQYETANNRKPPYDNGKVVTFENPKPKYPQPPQVGPQPRKEGHQQTIDSREARKRYGGKAVNPPKREEMEYKGTINCVEAARKYNGVFVP